MANTTLQQPWLHSLVSTLRAPTVVMTGGDGQLRAEGAQGVLYADVRVLSLAVLTIDGVEPTPIAGGFAGADTARFSGVPRTLGDPSADPTVRVDRLRAVASDSMQERIQITSTASGLVRTEMRLRVAADHARVAEIKSGLAGPDHAFEVRAESGNPIVEWSDPLVRTTLTATGATLGQSDRDAQSDRGSSVELCWPLELGPGESTWIEWSLQMTPTAAAPVTGVSTPDPWTEVAVRADDHRLEPLVSQSLTDLDALRMARASEPRDEFLAAGSPWFFTLFGRDSIWAARLMLPFGSGIAGGTLRALAGLQGTKVDARTAEQPGKIPHEQRQSGSVHPTASGGAATMYLPPLYYGTVDATPLWICLLHDAWRWGLPADEVRELLPALQRALGWLRDYSDPDGDGFLEYLDATGTGLANQGWKDSGDSIRFADGSLAEGPVALCEVQGYAYEAAMHGADLLDAFGLDGAKHWRNWAAALRERFRASFWVSGRAGRHPALALDGNKKPVDSLTSNIGHLLGTGILDDEETAQVAALISGNELSSGYGLRTMSRTDGGYSPLSYHCGSVWPHDTAIAIRGLAASGRAGESFGLIDGLLAAGVGFSYRLPELFSGDSASEIQWPVPYPAACRPQAWSAASIGAIVQALLGLEVDSESDKLEVRPPSNSPFGAISVQGIRRGAKRMSVAVDTAGKSVITTG
ncbi:MAG: hypothetical protein QOH56_1051 [Pseudonocardiales bacterium]|nr:hypothetical protein [Pseudonocardiales bacterium]